MNVDKSYKQPLDYWNLNKSILLFETFSKRIKEYVIRQIPEDVLNYRW